MATRRPRLSCGLVGSAAAIVLDASPFIRHRESSQGAPCGAHLSVGPADHAQLRASPRRHDHRHRHARETAHRRVLRSLHELGRVSATSRNDGGLALPFCIDSSRKDARVDVPTQAGMTRGASIYCDVDCAVTLCDRLISMLIDTGKVSGVAFLGFDPVMAPEGMVKL